MTDCIILHEWVDEHGEVESFIVLDLLSSADNFFSFPGAISTVFCGDEAKDLIKDYEDIKVEMEVL